MNCKFKEITSNIVMFEQIPLIEITKYLNNADFKSFRLTNKSINTRLIKEYEQRVYSLSNIINTIDQSHITKYLDLTTIINLSRCVPNIKIPIDVYAVNYNILRIMSGLGGLCYST